MKLAERRIASSSSTRCTLRLPSAIMILRPVGQGEVEGRPAQLRRLRPDAPPMARDDGMTDGEAEAHPRRFGADEGLEQILAYLVGQAGAAILDDDGDLAFGAPAAADPQPPGGALG